MCWHSSRERSVSLHTLSDAIENQLAPLVWVDVDSMVEIDSTSISSYD